MTLTLKDMTKVCSSEIIKSDNFPQYNIFLKKWVTTWWFYVLISAYYPNIICMYKRIRLCHFLGQSIFFIRHRRDGGSLCKHLLLVTGRVDCLLLLGFLHQYPTFLHTIIRFDL